MITWAFVFLNVPVCRFSRDPRLGNPIKTCFSAAEDEAGGRRVQGEYAVGFYSNVIFPRFYDCLMDKPVLAEHRKRQLASVDGNILEIGVGTGLNLPHYPGHIGNIVTVDPNPGMNKKLQRRIEQSRIDVDKRILSSEELPFENDAFDCVVSTLTLCSIPDVTQAMSELFRVLRPGGRLLYLEHGISPDARVLKWQRRLDWLQQRFADGCTLMLDVPQLLATQPFGAVEFETFYLKDTPKTHGHMFAGFATK